ncbi:MAG TPA: energy transducer TonB [Candidatus Solibacter sp.]|nr:energy transducer TonB [Candidatus Solibacter sp.]
MARPKRILLLTILASLVGLIAAPPQAVRGQDSVEAKRKIKTQVTPTYPELAKRMNLHGKVKLLVTVAPDGTVKSVRAVGGHPILVTASQDAIKNWKFEPAAKESTQVIEVNFD